MKIKKLYEQMDQLQIKRMQAEYFDDSIPFTLNGSKHSTPTNEWIIVPTCDSSKDDTGKGMF